MDNQFSERTTGLHGSEELGDIIDREALQSLMDDFYAVTDMGIGIIDLKGNVLVGTGWQDICTKFHRTNPLTLKNCIESDVILSQGVKPGEFKAYKCKNNLWDIVTPIFIGDQHIGNIFLGQFFYDDEPIDYQFFTGQAERYGFNKKDYLAALKRIPVWSRDKVQNLMKFYTKFATQISELSYSNLKLGRLVSYHNQAEEEREAHLWFWESMDKVNQAVQRTNDLEQMMSDVLDVMLSIFDCDRAWLVYPCDPNAPSWQAPMERTKPEYPGANVLGIEVPMDQGVSEAHKIALASDGPVKYGPGTENPVPAEDSEKWGYKCYIAMVIYPKIGSPWLLGMHQCSYARVWTAEEERLFQEIGRRLGDGLTSILAYREVQEREAHYRAIVESFDGLIYICSQDYRVEFMNERLLEKTGSGAVGDFCYRAFYGLDSVCPWCVNERVFNGETVRLDIKSPKDGRWRHIINTLIKHPDGSLSKQAMITDITEHKRFESIMQARLRLLESAGSCSVDELLTLTLDEIESLTGSTIGFYHFLESDQKTLSLQSWSTNTLTNMCTAEGKGIHYDIAQAGVWVDCIAKRGPVIHNDYASLPHHKGLPEGHAPVIREVVVPIFRGKLIKAIVGVGNKSDIYTENDIEIVSQLGDISWDIVERLLAEEAMRESEKRFRDLYENAPNAYFTIGVDGLVRGCNRRAEELLGYAVEELVGLPVLDFYADTRHGKEKAIQVLQRFRAGKTVRDEELEMQGADGSPVWISLTVDAVRDVHGRVVESRSMIIDITERKRAEEALRESEERYRAMFQNSPLGIFRTTFDGRFLEANPAAARLFGYDSPETLIREIHDIGKQLYAHPEDRPRIISEQTSSSGVTQHVNHYRRKDGSELIANLSLKTIHSTGGQSLYLDGIIEDITERIKAEEALRNANETLRATLEAAPVAIFDLDTEGRVKSFWNAAAEQMLGWSRDEVLGRFLPSVSEDKKEEFARFREWVRSGKRMDGQDVVRRRKDGSPIEYSIYAAPEYDDDDKVVGNIAVLVDITERKRAEDEIRKLNSELEQRVKDRTARLETANKELEAFAYSVSHDLRAPLRHIDGYLELLQKRTAGALDERGRHYMSIISESAKRMGALIDDLLSFSRIGRYEMSKGKVDLGDLVQHVIRELEPETEGRTIRWRIVDLPVITGDRALLRIVMVNLISNALKFTRPREETIIEIGSMPGEEGETVVFLRDNGVGFDMSYADKLFGVFQRLHRSDEFEGTGIGLANVHRIIKRHGGRIWAEGKVNQGATFYFSLPRALKGE